MSPELSEHPGTSQTHVPHRHLQSLQELMDPAKRDRLPPCSRRKSDGAMEHGAMERWSGEAGDLERTELTSARFPCQRSRWITHCTSIGFGVSLSNNRADTSSCMVSVHLSADEYEVTVNASTTTKHRVKVS